MILKNLKLVNFRNYKKEDIIFKPGTNILFGENGQGKTNILESIYYLALTKSFRTNNDQNLILNNETYFRIQGEFTTGQGKDLVSSIAFSTQEGKRLNYNNQKIQKFSEYIGYIPTVLLAPLDLEISQAGPLKRRQFLDIMLSQASQLYLHHLMQYRRSLKQRNSLLQDEHTDTHLLRSWDQALVQQGTPIIEKRIDALMKLDLLVKEYYSHLSGGPDKVKLVYQCSFPLKENEGIENNFTTALEKQLAKDRQVQSTTIGPHRDDILLLINGKPLRWIGSQGEHKTMIIALKMAEYQFLRNIQDAVPIMLFDDIFGELDAGRISNMISTLSRIGQVFITTTSPHFFGKLNGWPEETYFYEINQGQVKMTELV